MRVAMVGRRGVRIGSWIALSLGAFVCLAAQGASAAECANHPDALGTSRTLVVDPRAHPRIGAMQYAESLPLRDHEVVLTFDDGPVPRHSNQILQILADQCVKATFFIIGRQAQANPEGVRKLAAAGHTVGTHSQDHPLTFNKMSVEQAKHEVDLGIASTLAALGDPSALAPFFRVPGLLRGEGVETYAASQGLQLWSADFLADDWRHIPSGKVYDLAIKRLEARGKGVLLLHDIQARTVAALPKILHELKTRGYHIVHVVPATPERPATPTEAQEWELHPILENVPTAHWPKVPDFDLAGAVTLPTATLEDVVVLDGQRPTGPIGRQLRSSHGVPLPREAPWPRQFELSLSDTAPALPVPEASLFQIAEKSHAPTKPLILIARREIPAERPAREPAPSPTRSARAKPPAAAARTSHARHSSHTSRDQSHVASDTGSSMGEGMMGEGSSGAIDRSAVRIAGLRKR